MSWDLHLSEPECESCGKSDYLGWWNYTHKCNEMIRKAGMPWGSDELDGKTGAWLYEELSKVLVEFEKNPTKNRAMNPENGWGDFDSLHETLSRIKRVAAENPKAIISTSF